MEVARAYTWAWHLAVWLGKSEGRGPSLSQMMWIQTDYIGSRRLCLSNLSPNPTSVPSCAMDLTVPCQVTILYSFFIHWVLLGVPASVPEMRRLMRLVVWSRWTYRLSCRRACTSWGIVTGHGSANRRSETVSRLTASLSKIVTLI